MTSPPAIRPPAGSGEQGATRPAPAPRLKRAFRPLWRGPRSVQLGVAHERAVVLEDLDEHTARLLWALDRGQPAGTADADLLRVLTSAGAVGQGPRPAEDEPLAAEHALLELLHPDAGSAAAVLAARAATRVLVVGGGRTGAAVAHALAASGLGRVVVEDDEPVHPSDACPGGLSVADAGLRRGAAATALAVRAAPPTLTAGAPEVAVLCPDGAAPPDPARWWPLLAGGSALLCAAVRGSSVVVGPFTAPWGRCCPGCVREHRTDRDPAWPLVERQLADRYRRPAPTASATAVLALASLAAAQVLAWVDSGAGALPRVLPPSGGATLELALPGWEWRRRAWGPHPACRCAGLEPPG